VYAGVVNDGTGTYNPYTYSVSATVVDGTFSGTYTIVKTPTSGSLAMTEGPVAFAGGSITAQANEGVTRPMSGVLESCVW